MSGPERLRVDLERLDEVLEAFEHPAVDTRPSSRLLQATLRQRRAAIRDKLADARRDTLTVRLAAPHDIAARTVLDALAVVVDVVAEEVAGRLDPDPAPTVAVATTPHLLSVTAGSEEVVAVLSGPDDPGEVVPRTAEGERLLGVAMRAAVTRLGDPDDESHARLAALLATGPVSAELVAEGPDGEADAEVRPAAHGS